jgi:beta-lactam-binding protein with PASTA domain
VTTVPALSGQTERTARIRAAQAHLSISGITEIRSPDYDSDIVIAHDPPAATQANGVALLLNRGGYPVAYVMPDVIGMNAAQAGDVLRERGFHVTVATASATTGLPSGTVVRQQPSGGFRVALTDPISLEATR